MIITQLKSPYAVNLKLENGNTFYPALVVVRTLPVRMYDKPTKVWSIPIIDLPTLVKKCKHHKVPLTLDDKTRRQYVAHKAWRIGQRDTLVGDKSVEPSKYPITGTLLPFQVIGADVVYNACVESHGGFFCDPVGLGKTVQSIAVSERLMAERVTNFTIVICPSTLKRNWQAELAQFAPKRDVMMVGGDKPKRTKMYRHAHKFDYMLINYELLVRDLPDIQKYIVGRNYNYLVIVDEAQYTKNPDAKRTQCTKTLAGTSVASVGLSATPYETKLIDLFSGFQIIHPYILGEHQAQFITHYCETDYFGSVTGYKNLKELRSRMRPYVVRRLKEDVIDQLPERIENNYWVDLHPDQMKLYRDMERNIADAIEDMEKKQKIEMASVLPMITYLRQVCLSTKIVGHAENISTKTEVLMELLDTIGERMKVVVFCHFTGMVELLHETLTKEKVKHTAIHGGGGTVGKTALVCPIDQRIPTINAWQSDASNRVLVTSDILTEGVNIPAASYIVNFDMLFNPAKMEQRIGRLDRINQKHQHINIVNIIANGTLEEEIYERVIKRRSDSTAILDGGKVEARMSFQNIKSFIGLR